MKHNQVPSAQASNRMRSSQETPVKENTRKVNGPGQTSQPFPLSPM